jgi:hypothetical protein
LSAAVSSGSSVASVTRCHTDTQMSR